MALYENYGPWYVSGYQFDPSIVVLTILARDKVLFAAISEKISHSTDWATATAYLQPLSIAFPCCTVYILCNGV